MNIWPPPPTGTGLAGPPHETIRPGQGRLDWHALLDGSPLTAEFIAAGVLDRTLLLDGAPRNPAEVLDWISAHPGRTLFLTGDRGDGKTSYLNTLAARSVDTHLFLRWDQDVPLDLRAADWFAAATASAAPAPAGTLVVIFPIGADRNAALLEHLAGELSVYAGRSDRRAVVIVEGDDATFRRLPFYTAHEARLVPPGSEAAQHWVDLLRRACAEVRRGDGDQQIATRYPNLLQFLGADEAEQERILADPESPMIVRLLRAVYGADVWGRLYNELRMLRPPSPNAIGYLHVCLATLAGRGIPTYMLEALQPDTQYELRSMRDPWLRNDADEHLARHRFIAQAVLEKAVMKGQERLVQGCLASYAEHVRHPAYARLLRQIVLALSRLSPVASADETGRLRRVVFTGVRRGLRGVEQLGAALRAQCDGDYRQVAAWMEFVRALIPTASRDPAHLWLVELHEDLLDVAEETAIATEIDRLEYYRAKIERLRAWLLDEETYDFLYERVLQTAPFIGADWCRADFYVDLFRWSFRALHLRRTEVFEGHDAVDGRFLYATMFSAYERLRKIVVNEDIEAIRIDFNTMLLRHVHWQLPGDAADLVEHAWETSVVLEYPDEQAGTFYAEMLLTGRAKPPTGQDPVELACDILLMINDVMPGHGEALFLLAFARQVRGAQVESLPERIARARSVDIGSMSTAFLAHAEGLIEPDGTRRKELLLEALLCYTEIVERRRASGSHSGSYAVDRLDFASGLALKALNSESGAAVEAARRRYRRLAG